MNKILQGVVSNIEFPLLQDEMAVSKAMADLLSEGWKFQEITKSHITLHRIWEIEELILQEVVCPSDFKCGGCGVCEACLYYKQEALSKPSEEDEEDDTCVENCQEIAVLRKDIKDLKANNVSMEDIEKTISEFIPHRDSQYIKPLAQAIHNLLTGK